MPLLLAALLLLALIGWGWHRGWIARGQIGPVLLALVGLILMLKGALLPGTLAMLLAGGWSWRGGKQPRSTPRIANPHDPAARRRAAALLGVDEKADAAPLRAAYRGKMAVLHPDRGGDATTAQAMTEARDLLLSTKDSASDQ